MRPHLAVSAVLCSVSLAWPLLTWTAAAPPAAGTQFYQLQAKSASASVNNQYVTLLSSSSYSLGAQTAASRFFLQKYNATNTWAFHNADDTRQVALRGPSGVLLYMVDVTSPSSDTIPSGQLMEWATFTLDNNILGVKDGSTLTTRTFVAVQGTESGGAVTLALYDGVSNTTQPQVPLTLNVLRVGSGTSSVLRRTVQMIYG